MPLKTKQPYHWIRIQDTLHPELTMFHLLPKHKQSAHNYRFMFEFPVNQDNQDGEEGQNTMNNHPQLKFLNSK